MKRRRLFGTTAASSAVLLLSVVAAACGSASSGDTGAGSGSDGGAGGDAGDDGGVPPVPTGPMGDVPAARLLTQGTFGPTLDTIDAASKISYDDWLTAQKALPASLTLPLVTGSNDDRLTPWWTIAVNAPDQLRQRVAYSLSQILVISQQADVLVNNSQAVAAFGDMLVQGALGNYRDLLDVISHSPQMGKYLTFFKNDKANPATGSHADENYAREIMQLFTIGLVQLNADGTPKLDGSGNPIPTYTQADVQNLARVFTGWASAPIAPHSGEDAWTYDLDYMHQMQPYENHHDTDAKTIVGGITIPAGGTCESDMKAALDALFNHPNVGPFIGKQLIQRLVTSNPSPAYVSHVTSAFDDDGTGVRGNLYAVVRAVLTDPEARVAGTAAKLREPVVRFTHLYRAFAASDQGDKNISEQGVVGEGMNTLDQEPYYSPTVFNFYRPDYLRAGPLSVAGLVAPEFQITNEYTAVNITNQLEFSAYFYLDSKGNVSSARDNYEENVGPQTTLLHTAQWEPFVATPSTLVDNMDLVFMEGQMPSAMKTTLVNHVNALVASPPTLPAPTTLTPQIVSEITYLVTSSPQYSIQR